MSQSPSDRRPATISDVAEAAGVSRMTVSKVLRGTGRISEATRHRVSEIADKMGYVPSILAGALSSQTSPLVGVLIPSVSDQVYSGVLAGINAVLTPRGYFSLIGETFFDPANEARLVRMMLSMKPAGLIVSGGLPQTEATAHLLRTCCLRPVRLWDGDTPGPETTVGLSHDAAGRAAAKICLEAGFTRACYVGAQLQLDLCASRRKDGFVDALQRAGVACQVLADPDLTRTVQSGQILTERLLRKGEVPEVIHYLNDAMAIGGMRALFSAGFAVPNAVSVIGFNGTSLKHALRTRLTTFEVPVRQMGEHAARAVIGYETDPASTLSAIFVPQIIRGNTFRWPAE
ncbi:MAG: LacI family DNA-binding transcriptional regulator [Pseudotabrizicola sp.]|uniref:LacI family DNA-binding transcriptional regulator n=1 Tax=Pseudotabrizicola sp. TaxID=2939647 RepID=UPI00271E67F7|nr:LacI family DNA-binding transcriptional regulator [Pseudotabrizicola sp.]MDO8884173.1 LacI family DNA-binding transcriptional regulator [Pseudotabrizicola sp.]MDP2081182.1 LacI family DNA-binding transcriptional regulator [Pseudotabrizicola sp.]MDZ7573089.1 LacI family DNA-binding transcriptional regulator [Pseudotabrizicola sp.]